MVQSFYTKLGLAGGAIAALIIFALFILWLAGVAGITNPYDGGKPRGKTWQLVVSLIFPPYPMIWMITKINEQRKFLKKAEID